MTEQPMYALKRYDCEVNTKPVTNINTSQEKILEFTKAYALGVGGFSVY